MNYVTHSTIRFFCKDMLQQNKKVSVAQFYPVSFYKSVTNVTFENLTGILLSFLQSYFVAYFECLLNLYYLHILDR